MRFGFLYTLPLLAGLASLASPAGAMAVRTGTGDDAAGLTAIFEQFRADLGQPNNGIAPGSQGAGHRQITWDGGGAAANAQTFGPTMTNFANRGNVYTTPGTGFEISGQPSPAFGDINPTYPTIFKAFSEPRLFAPLGSNVMDVFFNVPGDAEQPALSRGFGAVFADVDLADTSSLEFFGENGESLGTFFVEAKDDGLSFLGVSFDEAVIARVRITTGNFALGPDDTDGVAPTEDGVPVDVVVLDDFIFGEPLARAVPEPSVLTLLGAGLLAAFPALRRRRRS